MWAPVATKGVKAQGERLTWLFQQLLHVWLSSLRQVQVQWIGKLSTACSDAEIIGVDLLMVWFKFGCLRLSISKMRCLSDVNCKSNSWLVHPKLSSSPTALLCAAHAHSWYLRSADNSDMWTPESTEAQMCFLPCVFSNSVA